MTVTVVATVMVAMAVTVVSMLAVTMVLTVTVMVVVVVVVMVVRWCTQMGGIWALKGRGGRRQRILQGSGDAFLTARKAT